MPSAGVSQAIPGRARQLVRGKLHAHAWSLHFPILWSSLLSWKEQRIFSRILDDSLGKHLKPIRIVLLGHWMGEAGA